MALCTHFATNRLRIDIYPLQRDISMIPSTLQDYADRLSVEAYLVIQRYRRAIKEATGNEETPAAMTALELALDEYIAAKEEAE